LQHRVVGVGRQMKHMLSVVRVVDSLVAVCLYMKKKYVYIYIYVYICISWANFRTCANFRTHVYIYIRAYGCQSERAPRPLDISLP
jgi:hypothetical protein